ncbi:MAG: hypothetical protein SFY95_02225 [Planctomycetota bacterium]|nr:hypothetical protein [Planctomycetota bacterium]
MRRSARAVLPTVLSLFATLPAGCGWFSSKDAATDATAEGPAGGTGSLAARPTGAGQGPGPNSSLEALIAQSARDIESLRSADAGANTDSANPTATNPTPTNPTRANANALSAGKASAGSSAGGEQAPSTIRVERADPNQPPQPTRITSLTPEASDGATAPDTGPNTGLAAVDSTSGSPAGATPASGQASGPTSGPVAPKSADERVREHVEALAQALRERAQSATHPLADYAAAAALESLKPGLMADAESPSSPIWAGLSPSERATLSSVRLAAAGLARLREADADPAQFERDLERARAPFASSAGVTIARASLASRVEGFGRDVPFASTTFVAGRPTRAILYVEMGRFGHRAARASDPGFATLAQSPTQPTAARAGGDAAPIAYAVELAQELALFNATDSTPVWTRPEQTVTDVSRNQRRDFFLVREIELPANLSVGSYTLRVTVRDRSASGAEAAETSIPITIVAERASR